MSSPPPFGTPTAHYLYPRLRELCGRCVRKSFKSRIYDRETTRNGNMVAAERLGPRVWVLGLGSEEDHEKRGG